MVLVDRSVLAIRHATLLAGAMLLIACAPEGPDDRRAATEAVDPAPAAAPAYAGVTACADCHADIVDAWRSSNHRQAMELPTPDTVLGDFADSSFEHQGVTSRFAERDGQYLVRTDGPDGEPAEFPVRYTFGAYPLQQYLLELPGGKLQALSVAWDTRPADEGGQRWFHVYGDEPIDADDLLHWTRPSQNWETMCADCHSTALSTRYDVDNDRFDTTYKEINVACEACHGPASRHIDWAKDPGSSDDAGLLNLLNERDGIAWIMDPETGNSRRSAPRTTSREINTCAPCHARRAEIGELGVPGGELLDAYLPAFIDPPLYHVDGQVLDEVYVYGSFLQSKMHAKGVTCGDCHDPHSLALRAPGEQVCGQCHDPALYARTEHTLHAPGSVGADCVECHMRPSNFMQIDARNDHSFRVPRPHLAAEFDTPVSCLNCHADRDAAWAAGVLDSYGMTPPAEPVHWSRLLAGAGRLPAESRNLLLGIAAEATNPPIIRATAMARLNLQGDSLGVAVIGQQLASNKALIRLGAARALQTAVPEARARLVPPLLDDPVKAVRMAAVMSLAPLGPEVLPAGTQQSFNAAVDEYIAAQLLNAERGEAHTNIANLQRHLGRNNLAEQSYRTALKVNDSFVPAYVNLADLYRAVGDEESAETTLLTGLDVQPEQAALRHSLGLSLVRQGRMADAVPELKAAADSPDATPRYALAYGLVLDSQGDPDAARVYLAGAIDRFGDDPALVSALVNFYQRDGNLEKARELAARLPRQ